MQHTVKMHFVSQHLASATIATLALSASSALAAPSGPSQQDQLVLNTPQLENAANVALGPFAWLGSKVAEGVSTLWHQAPSGSHVQQAGSWSPPSLPHWNEVLGCKDDDTSKSTIWELINSNEHTTQLAHVLNYSSDATKDLLANGTDLTVFAPINQQRRGPPHHGDHGHDHADLASRFSTATNGEDVWAKVDALIKVYESIVVITDDDKDRKERHRKILTHIIDAVISYHVVDSPVSLTGRQMADNSTVATKLKTNWRKLNDEQPWRVKVSGQLLPFPSLKLNYYSTVVKPDVKASNGLVHAIRFPLLPPPSILQSLYFATPELSGTSLGLLKSGGEGYLALPKGNATETDLEQTALDNFMTLAHADPQIHLPGPGTAAATFVVPSNWAWRRLPPAIRLFLLSPWGEHWLGKLFMLHAIPHDIVFADSVHHVKAVKASSTDGPLSKTEEFDVPLPANLRPHPRDHTGKVIHDIKTKIPGLPHLPTHHNEDISILKANVTHFKFLTALPKIDWKKYKHHPRHGGDDDKKLFGLENDSDDDEGGHEGHKHYESVNVSVYRYHILPGNVDPVQTRVTVQGVPVWYQDIPSANGVMHVTHSFIMPNHLRKRRGQHSEVESQMDVSEGVKNMWEALYADASRVGYPIYDDEAE